MNSAQITRRVRDLLQSRDFRENPARAVYKRAAWRIRWQLSTRPWTLSLPSEQEVRVPRSGAGAMIYYQGSSEPEVADFVPRFLKPGMVFLDIGAHVGEFTLLGARAVGPAGQVHAFEPNVEVFELLCENVRTNRLENAMVINLAVSDVATELEFEICEEASVSALKSLAGPGKDRKVLKCTVVHSEPLDSYWPEPNPPIDLIKMDIEGAEMLAFLGSQRLLELPGRNSPVWMFEYAPHNYARFNYRPSDVFQFLSGKGYTICEYHKNGGLQAFPMDSTRLTTTNLIAAKDPTYVRGIIG